MGWLGLFLWLGLPEALGQCALCKATAQAHATEAGQAAAQGLNMAILYLMAIPYVACGILAYRLYFYKQGHIKLWWHKKRAKRMQST